MINLKIQNFLLIVGLVFTGSVEAAVNPGLAAYFKEKILQVQNSGALDQSSSSFPGVALQNLEVELTPQGSFDVPGLAQIAIVPEMDFVLVPSGKSPDVLSGQ